MFKRGWDVYYTTLVLILCEWLFRLLVKNLKNRKVYPNYFHYWDICLTFIHKTVLSS